MGIIKCSVCPKRGKFEVERYYEWEYKVGEKAIEKSDLYIYDRSGTRICFSVKEVKRFFSEIQFGKTYIDIYIDRKKELIFVPVFTHEIGYGTTLDFYYRLTLPYTKEDIGQMFQEVWEKHKNHEVVTAKIVEQTTPFYKIVMKGKGWPSFTSGRWLISANYVLSDSKVNFQYNYKEKGYSYGLNKDDRIIERIVPMPASNQEIGNSIISIFEEAKIY